MVGYAIAAVVLVALIAAGLPAWTRLLVLFPAWGAAVTWLQARRRFCVGFAVARGSPTSATATTAAPVEDDPAQRAADRRTSLDDPRRVLHRAGRSPMVAVLLPV